MNLVVKPHNPWKTWTIRVLIFILLLVGGYTLFDYGRFLAGFDSDEAGRVRQELLKTKKQLEGEIDTLRQEKALLERARQIERQAYDELDATLKVLQAEILELKEELAFYRGIVSPREASTGLQLQKFSLEPNGPGRSYHFKVVLTQVLKNDSLASGRVQLQFDGIDSGGPRSLSLREVTENSVKELNYRFKYFQNLEGDIELPEAFTLLRATVKILPRGYENDSIERTIDWSSEEKSDYVGKQKKT